MITWGPGFVSSKHEHHSVELAMALEGKLRVRSGPEQNWIDCRAALVKPDASHEIDASKAQILLVLVDPASNFGAALLDSFVPAISPVRDEIVATWRKELGDYSTLSSARLESWVKEYLLCGDRPPRLHPKVRRVLGVIREELGDPRSLSLKHMAAIAGLSESRFMHVFTESVGVPLRPYIRWLRLQHAWRELMDGSTVTEAAHRTGFADAAHLTRTVRRMMGTTPRELIRRRLAHAGL